MCVLVATAVVLISMAVEVAVASAVAAEMAATVLMLVVIPAADMTAPFKPLVS